MKSLKWYIVLNCSSLGNGNKTKVEDTRKKKYWLNRPQFRSSIFGSFESRKINSITVKFYLRPIDAEATIISLVSYSNAYIRIPIDYSWELNVQAKRCETESCYFASARDRVNNGSKTQSLYLLLKIDFITGIN